MSSDSDGSEQASKDLKLEYGCALTTFFYIYRDNLVILVCLFNFDLTKHSEVSPSAELTL